MGRGIDYSPPGSDVNRDVDTGIRYGVIPLGALADHALESFEPEYDACCPHCGEEVPEDTHFTTENRPAGKSHGYWTVCASCEKPFQEDEQYGDEPSRNALDDGDTQGMLASDNDVWVFKSPYFTRAGFCSPCAPGACYLTSACDDGERAYCLGHDWFEGHTAPYPVYNVETGEMIASPSCEARDYPDGVRVGVCTCDARAKHGVAA